MQIKVFLSFSLCVFCIFHEFLTVCSAFSRVQSFRYGYVLCADPVMGVVGPTERVRPGSAFRDKGVPHGRDMRTLGSRPLLVDQATHHCS